MDNFFNKFFGDHLLSSLLTVLCGIIITIFNEMALSIICIALGCISTILGLINIVKYFRTPEEAKYNLLTGLIFGALGLSVVFNTVDLSGIVAVVIGIIILYHGIVNCQNAMAIKSTGYEYWYLSLIFALATVLAGILLIVLKDVFVSYITLIIGITLIVEGALNTWTAIKVRKN